MPDAVQRRAGQHGRVVRPAMRAVLTGMASLLAITSVSRADPPVAGNGPQRFLFGFESDPGDYLGLGQTKVLTEADVAVSIMHEPGVVLIELEGEPNPWSFVFQAPRGSELVPGVYDATSGESPRKPAIFINGEHRFCAFVQGRFVVLEAVYMAGGGVARFAVDFELHCDSGDPIFFGYLRVSSDIAAPARRTPTPTPRPDHFVLTFDRRRGDQTFSARIDAADYLTSEERFFFPRADLRPHVSFRATNPLDMTRGWELVLASPICGDLFPGSFTGAMEYPFELPGLPAIGFLEDGHLLCGNHGASGMFVVHEAQFGEHGEIYRFAADFAQRCQFLPNEVTGSVFFTSVRPTPTPAPPTPTPSDYSSVAAVYSQLGDFVGHCTSRYLTLADGDFSAFYDLWGRADVAILFQGDDAWLFEFQAADGAELVPGTYRRATGVPAAVGPGLSISGQGRGCDDVEGQFTVHEIEFDRNHDVVRFAADFEQHCEGALPTLYGSVHFRSNRPPPTRRSANAPTPTPALGPCWGDCSGDGVVTVNELVLGVQRVLGDTVEPCAALDANGDGLATIDDVLRAVLAFLEGCDPGYFD